MDECSNIYCAVASTDHLLAQPIRTRPCISIPPSTHFQSNISKITLISKKSFWWYAPEDPNCAFLAKKSYQFCVLSGGKSDFFLYAKIRTVQICRNVAGYRNATVFRSSCHPRVFSPHVHIAKIEWVVRVRVRWPPEVLSSRLARLIFFHLMVYVIGLGLYIYSIILRDDIHPVEFVIPLTVCMRVAPGWSIETSTTITCTHDLLRSSWPILSPVLLLAHQYRTRLNPSQELFHE